MLGCRRETNKESNGPPRKSLHEALSVEVANEIQKELELPQTKETRRLPAGHIHLSQKSDVAGPSLMERYV